MSSQIESNETETGMGQCENQYQVTEDTDIRSLYMDDLCLFYIQLQAKYLVPSLTIHMIVEEINGLNDICHQYTKDKVKETLEVNTNMSDTEIDSVFQSLQETECYAACSPLLSTESGSNIFRITFPICTQKRFTWAPINIQSLTKVLSLIHFVETTANNLTFNKSIGFRNGSYES